MPTRGGSPWDNPVTPGGTVGQTGQWDACKGWESLGYPSTPMGTWDSPKRNRTTVGKSGHE